MRNIICLLVVGFLFVSCGQKTEEPESSPAVTTSEQVASLEQVKPAEPAAEPTVSTVATDQTLDITKELLVLQNFEENNGTEKIPDVYTWDYGKAQPEVVSENAFEGSRCLKTKGDMVGMNFMVREIDMTKHTRVFVYVFDKNGDNTIEITLRDMDNNEAKAWSDEKAKKDQWTRVSIPLAKYKDKLNLARIKNMQVYEWTQGAYYYDNAGISR